MCVIYMFIVENLEHMNMYKYRDIKKDNPLIIV